MIIKLTVEGAEYEWDSDRLLVAEARELKTHTGLTPPKWMMALDEQDPDAIVGLIYLAKKRAGENLRWSDLDTLDYADFTMEAVDPEAEDDPADGQSGDQPEAQAGVDPTPVSGETGTIPTSGTSPTSEPSPTTSSTLPETSAS
ncbi:hypothetical protein ME763_32235 [Streptomyces murinus]|uniref:hypothetical protein n=1 Tax=Streptomyces murinus TaxID=33900 RepID=UPI000A1F0F3B|nr:hypothetical protein [Streptomyces murinus]WDO09960.1 hypothetical protein ME763_32235 [Streptomyces murinus]